MADARQGTTGGPLAGVRVLEVSGLGPAPFAAMLLAELGADVVKIDRPGGGVISNYGLDRSKRSIALDLKTQAGVETAKSLAAKADILIEGFRPGVMERMGLGPEPLLAANPRLIYGRLTGWGQDGPLSQSAGHDLNYMGLTGALWAIGDRDRPPPPPLNIGADFAGGSLYLVMGVLAALTHALATGEGQVVDAAMVDGASSLVGLIYGLRGLGVWGDERQDNLLDGGAPWYACYACADGKFIALAALEPQFWVAFLTRAGLDDPIFQQREDRKQWPRQREALTAFFATHDRDHWATHFADVDACVSPVLSFAEAPQHPHNRMRGTFAGDGRAVEVAAAPRFSATPSQIKGPPPEPDADRAAVLCEWGVEPS